MLLYILSLPAWAAPVSLSPDVVITLPQGIWLTRHQMFTGDLNGDGAPDVVLGATANTGLGPAGTLVYGSDGRRLRPAPAQQLLDFAPVGLIPDADGDGDDELVLVEGATGTTTYAPGSPVGLTVPSMVALTGPETYSDAAVPLWDVNRDGYVDVAINTIYDVGVGVGTFPGSATGLVPWMMTWTANLTYEQMVHADVNGDGYQDALVTTLVWGGNYGPERTLQLAWGGPAGIQLPLTPAGPRQHRARGRVARRPRWGWRRRRRRDRRPRADGADVAGDGPGPRPHRPIPLPRRPARSRDVDGRG